jgi:hypothetical protein
LISLVLCWVRPARIALVRHHRKAAPLLTRPGRLDGGVEGQQVGLSAMPRMTSTTEPILPVSWATLLDDTGRSMHLHQPVDAAMALPTTSRAASDPRAASLVAVAALEALAATSWAVELISVTAVTT